MRRREKGYALIVVLLMAALAAVAVSVAVPRLLTQGQREKEEELIFRGGQYQRAIGRYYKKFGRFPQKMEDLLWTNERAFLRREFPDPMTKDGKWRLIRVGPGGVLIGSVRKPVPGPEGDASKEEDKSRRGRPPEKEKEVGDPSVYPIAGVASRSEARAIRVYQGYTHYFEWEFIFDPAQIGTQPGPPPPPPPPSRPQ